MASSPGWYVDHTDSAYEMYWDGMGWTNERRPLTLAGMHSAKASAADIEADPNRIRPDPAMQPGQTRWRHDEPAVENASYPPRAPLRERKPWAVSIGTGLAGLVVGILVGGLGVGAIGAMNENAAKTAAAEKKAALKDVFPEAVDNCNADRTYAVVSDGDRTLTIDHEGDEDYRGGLSSTEMWCIIEVLGAPTAVMSHMEQTTSLDGRQTESWGNIEVSWSYHPDRGMDAVFEIVD